jgi:hypothetical protein
VWKDISSEELFAFLGFCIVSGNLRTRKEPAAKLRTTNTAYARPIMQQWQGMGSFKFFVSFVSMTKLQEINRDQQTN